MSEKNNVAEKKQWKNSNRFCEKLGQKLLQLGLNQQKLASKSRVSDSEISRIMTGKSLPGLENAISLARAVEVSLDYLADDSMDIDPSQAKASSQIDDKDAEILRLAREIGHADATYILRTARYLGPEMALHRLLDAKPVIAPGGETAQRPVATPIPAANRVNSA
ncbi:helix-turn-helix domain-containing protein [Tundrisphaera sp. TA3]|uniref:helix-turn-helix domain-containing protein n=1 Tax=Tundrisphaera sp. TA3 TaxID=3435775 RepID=UPI003EBDA1F7